MPRLFVNWRAYASIGVYPVFCFLVGKICISRYNLVSYCNRTCADRRRDNRPRLSSHAVQTVNGGDSQSRGTVPMLACQAQEPFPCLGQTGLCSDRKSRISVGHALSILQTTTFSPPAWPSPYLAFPLLGHPPA